MSDDLQKPRRPATTSWRSAHRSRSHDSAHAEHEESGGGRAPAHGEMPLVPRGPATLVFAQHDLDALLAELRAAGSFAYDTEFIGELTYHPLLCLIQVATTERIYLIDPMVEMDLRGLWELLADVRVQKIVHAGQQDVEPVARLLGVNGGGHGARARNVVDTQITAGFAGMAYPVALSKLVMELTGVKLGKGLTFTHWDQRPLSDVQLRYAADDVRYLPAAWDALRTRVQTLGHLDWAIEECEAACDPAQFGFNPETTYQRIRGAGTLSAAGLSVLRDLAIWRNGAARDANVPARSLMKDEVLLDLARSPVKSREKLDRVRGLPRPVENEFGGTIVDVTLNALTEAPARKLAMPKQPEPTPTQRFRADALFNAAGVICSSRAIDVALAASRQDIGEFYHRYLANEPLDALHLMTGWRRVAIGEPLLKLLRGEDSIHTTWRDGAPVDVKS